MQCDILGPASMHTSQLADLSPPSVDFQLCRCIHRQQLQPSPQVAMRGLTGDWWNCVSSCMAGCPSLFLGLGYAAVFYKQLVQLPQSLPVMIID